MWLTNRRAKELIAKSEWLDILDSHSGVGLWDAILHEGDALHAKARWTWSAEFRRLCGFSSEAEFPNVVQSWADRLHPDDVEATFAAFNGALSGKAGSDKYDMTYRLKIRDGSYRWFHATGGVVRDASGKRRLGTTLLGAGIFGSPVVLEEGRRHVGSGIGVRGRSWE